MSGNPSDFYIMHPLVPVVKSYRKNFGEGGGVRFKGSNREKCHF